MLDNAEHLVDAVADLAARLLAAAPGLQLLVTSQRALQLAGEQVLPLAPLALPADLADDAPDPQGYAAARLFCARVRQRQPGWSPSAAERAEIAAICRGLDGVPLALELAAARVPLLGVAGVRSRLDERFALLTMAPRDAAARHRSLGAALDWTCGLLNPSEQQALQRLAVFPGSVTPEAAEAVLADLVGTGHALDLVDALRERSLLVAEPQAEGMRLRLFDSVRRHALARLDASGEQTSARRRQLRWLRTRFERFEQDEFLQPLLHWLPPLRAETDNLRAALAFGLDAAAAADAQDDAKRLVAASAMFRVRSGQRVKGWRWLQAARVLPATLRVGVLLARSVEEVRRAGMLREQIALVAIAACVHLRCDAGPATLALAREAVRLLQAEGMLWWMADALPWRALHDGRPDDAARLQAWADARAGERGDTRGPLFARLRAELLQQAAPRASPGRLRTAREASTDLPPDLLLADWTNARVRFSAPGTIVSEDFLITSITARDGGDGPPDRVDVPEPASLALAAVAGLALVGTSRRRRGGSAGR